MLVEPEHCRRRVAPLGGTAVRPPEGQDPPSRSASLQGLGGSIIYWRSAPIRSTMYTLTRACCGSHQQTARSRRTWLAALGAIELEMFLMVGGGKVRLLMSIGVLELRRPGAFPGRWIVRQGEEASGAHCPEGCEKPILPQQIFTQTAKFRPTSRLCMYYAVLSVWSKTPTRRRVHPAKLWLSGRGSRPGPAFDIRKSLSALYLIFPSVAVRCRDTRHDRHVPSQDA